MKTFFMMGLSVVMQIRYWLDPSALERDVQQMKKDKKFEINDDNKKYWMGDSAENVENFMFTWKNIRAAFKAMFQDISKVGLELL